MKRKILSHMLSLCIVLGLVGVLFAAFPITSSAENVDTAIVSAKRVFAEPTAVSTGSGTYYQPDSYIYFGYNGSTPIKWRVLDSSVQGTTSDYALLWSEYVLDDSVYFQEEHTTKSDGTYVKPDYSDVAANEWQYSDAQTWSAAKYKEYFTDYEKKHIVYTDKTDSETTLFGENWGDTALSLVNMGIYDYLYPLSVSEIYDYVGTYNSASGIAGKQYNFTAGASYWLRSPLQGTSNADSSSSVAYVTTTGSIAADNANQELGMRPAMKISVPSSCVFASAAAAGKPTKVSTMIEVVAPYEGNEYKLTLCNFMNTIDLNITLGKVSIQDDYLTVEYTGATGGENHYITLYAKDKESGDITHYSKVVDLSDVSGVKNGSFTVYVGSFDFDTHELYLITEQCNGNYQTDYASTPCEIKCPLDESMFEIDLSDETYTGAKITKTVNATIDASEYKVTYSTNTNVGTAKMIISASTTGNYSGQISYTFNIIKADPEVSWPEGLTGASGALLSSVEAGEGFSWQNGEQTIACGANSCALVYTPTDTKNYNTMTNDVTVTGEHSYTNDVCISCGQVIISDLSFPDEVFRGCVNELDAASDGVLTPAELEGILEINCYNKGVSTLAGIENFKNLQKLDCAANDLTELDVSGLPALKTLYCHSNKLTKLDVSANTALTELNCSDNALKELVFGENADLSTLYCSNNAIASLDVSGLASLMMFECNNNKLTSLDVSGLTRLNTLYCSAQTNKSLKSLTLNGCTSLMELKCDKNSLTSLDVSGLTQLEKLDCNSNKLTSLDAKNLKSLTELNCSNNALTSLDVSGCTSLRNLGCYFQENKSLTYLGISGCTALEQINCSGNSLTELDLSGFAKLKNFFGQGNDLTKLTLDGCVSLERLTVQMNQLTSLDVSDCTELIVLSCSSNRLTDIDLSKNVNLSSVTFTDQTLDITIPANAVVDMNDYVGDTARITSISPKMNSDGRIVLDAGVDKIEYTIATGYEDTLSVTIKISNPHAHDEGDVCACGAVRISDTTFPDEAFRGYVSELDAASDGLLTPAELEGILEILCYNKGISTLAGIENFKNLQKLDCADNDLTELDLSANTALESFGCENNKLTSLVFGENEVLVSISCKNNALTALDLSGLPALQILYCDNNALTALDLGANTAINTFVSYTQKSTIKLSDESSFDMNDLGIDLSKITIASEYTSYENGIVTVGDNTTSVYYTYATGYGENVMYVELVIERSAFRKVNIALGESINVNYYIKCNVDYPELRLTLDGKTVTVEGEYDESGFIKFVFEGVSPQRIGDTIIAELIHDGDVIETKQYSVLEYLNALKAKSAEKLWLTEEKYADMLTLVNDLLVYGGAAQSYTGHNTDALVSEGVTGTQFVPLTQSDTSVNNGDNVAFVGATVYFDSVNKLKFKFTAKNLTEIGFIVSINGTQSPNLIIDYEDNGDGTYVITVGNPIKAYGFDDVYTITACESYTTPTDTVLTYSVKSYVYAMQDADGPVAELVKALYNYGLSAKKYSGIN